MAFAVDYLLHIGCFVLAVTLYSGQPLLLNALLLAPSILVYTLPPIKPSKKKKPKAPPAASAKDASNKLPDLPLKPFLATYRAFMLVTTMVAILAVDFHLFPRRFAKVETWGTSLMDMGVGAFVFSGGIVAARPILKQRQTGRTTSLVSRVFSSLRHSIPLLVLGVIRLLSVKGLDYAEHVTEYGVHWNFFFTLAFLPPLVAACQSVLWLVPSYSLLALIISGTYQVLLETTDLKAYVLTAPRVDLISMNREGLFSFWGYLAIFLAGQDLGMFIIPRKINTRSTAPPGVERNTLLMTIAFWAAFWCGLYSLCTGYSYGFGLQVSRRLANLPYVLWVAGFNSVQLFAFCVVDTIFFPAFYNATDAKAEKEAYLTATSRVLRAYNRNGLFVFLLANLLTGLVNMTFNTLEATPTATMAILVGYSLAVTVVAVALDVYDITIRI